MLLSRASSVFGTMIQQDNFMEGAAAQVTIKDFSATAVEAFLRFLHFGALKEGIATILEVGMLADKYAVNKLHRLCVQVAREALTPRTACTIYQYADRFQHVDLRRHALQVILQHPKEALEERPSLSFRLVREILASKALCIDGPELTELISEWTACATKVARRVQCLFEAYATNQQPCLRQATEDALYYLKGRNAKFGPATHAAVFIEGSSKSARELLEIAHNVSLLELGSSRQIVWMLPFV